MQLSVIIPILRERETIVRAIERVAAEGVQDIVVVDGGSDDGGPDLACAAGARVLSSPRGRGVQQNMGARAALGDTLLFLHADTQPPPGFPAQIERTLSEPGVVAGAFRFKLDDEGPGMRLVEFMVRLRCHYRSLPYGDQGIFLRKDVFNKVGGFPDEPLLEDYELIRRLRRHGRIAIAEGAAVTSARRWRKFGLIRTTCLNNLCLLAYWLRISPERIARWRGSAF